MQTDLPGKDLLMTLPAEDRRNFASIMVSISLKNFFDSIPNVVLMPYLYDIGALYPPRAFQGHTISSRSLLLQIMGSSQRLL